MTDKTPATEAALERDETEDYTVARYLAAETPATEAGHYHRLDDSPHAHYICCPIYRDAIEAEAREQQGWSEAEAYAKGRADFAREAASRSRIMGETPATEAGRLDALWEALWADLQLTSRSHEPVGILPSGAATIARHRPAIEAEARDIDAYGDGLRTGLKRGAFDALREAAEQVRALPGWFAPEGTHGSPEADDYWTPSVSLAAVLAILTEQDHG